jgi:phenylacetyl-CoA:acceptor oxidoreductase 26-kDa subunit
MTYGPNPWQQQHWDWRAAGNFICGGAGSGLLIFTALSGVQGLIAILLALAGLALVGLGLLCVWLEIGRPLRAMNVFINARQSWMSREALASVLVFLLGLGVLVHAQEWDVPLAIAALAFIYCQARIVQAAKGIPAWREPLTVPLLVATGLAEGAGLFWIGAALQHEGSRPLAIVFGLLVAARWLLWRAWRNCIGGAAPRALAAIDRSGRALHWFGGVAPMVLIGLDVTGLFPGLWGAALMALAGLGVAATGALFKFTLITRAAFNQGFALAQLPVRGVRRSTPIAGSQR